MLGIKTRFCAILLLFSLGLSAEERTLVILHTNDFHGHIGQESEYAGAARIAAFVEQTRADNPGVLVLDAGDAVSGTPVSTIFDGVPIFEVLNLVGYDAAALGNHEFDYGYRQILKFRSLIDYPMLSANAFAANGSLIADAPALIKEVNGIKIGIVGLITDTTPAMITTKGNEGISFSPPAQALRAMVSALRPEVDLLIVLSHVGHEEEKLLAAEVDGVDLIIGGHSHTAVDPAVKINDTYVVQAGFYGKYVGRLSLRVDTTANRITSFRGELVPAAELPPARKDVDKIVKQWEAKVSELVDFEIAQASRRYSKAELQPILEAMLVTKTGADLGFYNAGGIRDYIRKGNVTARHIWNIEPFGNTLVTIAARGRVIKRIMGIQRKIHPGLEQIDDNQAYVLASNSFVASQAAKMEGAEMTITDTGLLVRDVLIDHIKRSGIRAE